MASYSSPSELFLQTPCEYQVNQGKQQLTAGYDSWTFVKKISDRNSPHTSTVL